MLKNFQIIPRPYYLNLLHDYQNNGLIKVILGPRRCGKSFLLEMFQDQLRQQGISNERIITVNLDDFENKAKS